MGIEVTYLDIRKAIYGTSFTNIILNSEKLKSFPLRSRTRKGILLSHFFFQNSFGNHSYDNQMKKKQKGIQIGKEKVKLSLFVEDMILYIDSPYQKNTRVHQLIQGSCRIQN